MLPPPRSGTQRPAGPTTAMLIRNTKKGALWSLQVAEVHVGHPLTFNRRSVRRAHTHFNRRSTRTHITDAAHRCRLNPAFPCAEKRIEAFPSSPMALFERSHSINAPVTATMAATDFAPIGPMLLAPMLSDASLVSLLLWMASQTVLTPSSLRSLKDKSRAVSPPVTATIAATAVAPTGLMLLPATLSFVSLLPCTALQIAVMPSSLIELPAILSSVSPPLTRRASAIAVMPSAV